MLFPLYNYIWYHDFFYLTTNTPEKSTLRCLKYCQYLLLKSIIPYNDVLVTSFPLFFFLTMFFISLLCYSATSIIRTPFIRTLIYPNTLKPEQCIGMHAKRAWSWTFSDCWTNALGTPAGLKWLTKCFNNPFEGLYDVTMPFYTKAYWNTREK